MNLRNVLKLDTILAILLLIFGLTMLILGYNNPVDIKVASNNNQPVVNQVDTLNNLTGSNITTDFVLKRNLFSATKFNLKVDDCLLNIEVNSQNVNLKEFYPDFDSRKGYCDYDSKVEINLSQYMNRETNNVRIITSNNSAQGGVIWSTNYFNYGILLALFLIALAGFYLFYQVMEILNINPINSCFVLIVIMLGIVVRIRLLPFESGDYGSFLTHWYDHIVNNGYWAAHKTRFSDYTPPYLYLMTIAALLPIKKIIAIKLISLIFEALLAVAVYLVVKQRLLANGLNKSMSSESAQNLAIVAGITSFFLPTVILNGSMWGQCDAIYSSFMVISLYFLTRNRGALAFVAFGIAFAFKFQTMFMAPLLLIWLIFNPRKFYYTLLVPIVYVIGCIPAAIAGRPWPELLKIYIDQSSSYPALNSGLINLWKFIPETHNQIFNVPGIMLGAVAGLAIPILIYNLKPKFTPALWVKLALICTLLIPFILPKMHERYYFSAEILSLIYAFYFPKKFWVAIVVSLLGVFSYLPFLLGRNTDEYSLFLVMAMLTVITYLIYELIVSLLNLKQLDRFESAKAVARLPGV